MFACKGYKREPVSFSACMAAGSGYLCAAMGLMVAGTRTPGGQRAGAPLTTADADVGTAGSKAYRRATSAPSSSSSSETLASGSAPLASGSAEHCVPVPVPVALQGGERAHGTMAGCPAGPSDPWGTSASQAEEGAGLVIGCDKVPELVEHSKHALHAAVPHLMDDGTISVLHGNALDPGERRVRRGAGSVVAGGLHLDATQRHACMRERTAAPVRACLCMAASAWRSECLWHASSCRSQGCRCSCQPAARASLHPSAQPCVPRVPLHSLILTPALTKHCGYSCLKLGTRAC